MEFTDYMLWKLIAVGVIAFCYRFWRAAALALASSTVAMSLYFS